MIQEFERRRTRRLERGRYVLQRMPHGIGGVGVRGHVENKRDTIEDPRTSVGLTIVNRRCCEERTTFLLRSLTDHPPRGSMGILQLATYRVLIRITEGVQREAQGAREGKVEKEKESMDLKTKKKRWQAHVESGSRRHVPRSPD